MATSRSASAIALAGISIQPGGSCNENPSISDLNEPANDGDTPKRMIKIARAVNFRGENNMDNITIVIVTSGCRI